MATKKTKKKTLARREKKSEPDAFILAEAKRYRDHIARLIMQPFSRAIAFEICSAVYPSGCDCMRRRSATACDAMSEAAGRAVALIDIHRMREAS